VIQILLMLGISVGVIMLSLIPKTQEQIERETDKAIDKILKRNKKK
jgi:hypothetical protein